MKVCCHNEGRIRLGTVNWGKDATEGTLVKVKILDVVERISTGVGKFAGFLVLVLVAVVGYEVVARYAFNAPAVWSYQLTRYLWGVSAILASAWTLQQKRHVSIDIVPSKLSPRAKAILSLVLYTLFFFPLMGIILWATASQAMWSWAFLEVDRAESIWAIPLYPIKTVIPIAVFLLLLQGIVTNIRDLRSAIKGS